MDAKYIRERITQLRLQKGISEYKLSYDLGHSRGYINNISSGKSLPSMAEFLSICDYFEITPQIFFDESLSSPKEIELTLHELSNLDEADLKMVRALVLRLRRQ